jgi:DNA-directed RNA polymerase III subunit RPC4
VCDISQLPSCKLIHIGLSRQPVGFLICGMFWQDTSKYYPVILPLQRPANERTRYLDEDCGVEHDENALTAAQELDLFDESEEDKLMFFQIPASLPLGQDAAVSRESDQDEMVGSVKEGTRNSSAGVKLEKLPEGHVGKLLVYKSGAVKLKIGDVLFDALPGTDCMFAQELAAVNPTAKHCCFLGDVRQRVILTPDIDSLLT